MKELSEKGQVVIVLLLTILVGLSVGLVVTQRTITDVTTSTQTEQSSRAFSAAEAGLERALSGATGSELTLNPSDTDNDSTAQVEVNLLPNPEQALQYPDPGTSKDQVAQFWLADPDTLTQSYPPTAPLNLYFGKSGLNQTDPSNPAVETILVYRHVNDYFFDRQFIDVNYPTNPRSASGFVKGCDNLNPAAINTTSSPPDVSFGCRVQINTPVSGDGNPNVPIMLRVKLLYANNAPIALDPNPGESLPIQAAFYYSTGRSGQSQKLITVFQLKKVLPSFLEHSIFSKADIVK